MLVLGRSHVFRLPVPSSLSSGSSCSSCSSVAPCVRPDRLLVLQILALILGSFLHFQTPCAQLRPPSRLPDSRIRPWSLSRSSDSSLLILSHIFQRAEAGRGGNNKNNKKNMKLDSIAIEINRQKRRVRKRQCIFYIYSQKRFLFF